MAKDFEPDEITRRDCGEVRFFDRIDHDNSRITLDVAMSDHGIFILQENLDDESGDAHRSFFIWPSDIPAVIKALTSAYNWLSEKPYDENEVK